MSANTSKGWPYVLPADAVADYPTLSLALADKAEASVPFALAAGQLNLTFASSAVSDTVTVTLPVGRFTQTPLITLGIVSSWTGTLYAPRTINRSTTSFQMTANSSAAGSGSVGMCWLAVQMLTTAAPG